MRAGSTSVVPGVDRLRNKRRNPPFGAKPPCLFGAFRLRGLMHNEGVDATPAKESRFGYWHVVLVLVALGALTIFSFGLYFWFMAIALTLLSPFRSRPRIFLPGIALFLGFLVAYVLIAPSSCSQSFTSSQTTGEETVSPVVCTSPIGIEYSEPEQFEPSRSPALIAGVATAVTAAAVTWAVARSRTDPGPESVTS